MPREVAIGVLALVDIMAAIAVAVVIFAASKTLLPHLAANWVIRTPVFRRRPNQFQWLFDQAEAQRTNPSSHLVVTDRIAMRLLRDKVRPYLWVRVYYKYLGVHELVISQAVGYASFNSEQLPDNITRNEGGYTNVAPGGTVLFDLNIYIPPEFLEDFCREYDAGEIRGLGLRDVRAKVWVKDNDAPPVPLGLDADRMTFRVN